MSMQTRKLAGYQSVEDRVHQAFISSLRHDLKTPLSVIMGYCEFLIEDAGRNAPPPFVANLQKILSASHSLLSIVNEILDSTNLGKNRDEKDLKDIEDSLRKKVHVPLNKMIGLSEMLLKDAEQQDNESYLPDLQNILIAAKRFNSLIHDVIIFKLENEVDTSALGTGKTSNLVKDVMRTIQPLNGLGGDPKKINGGTILVVDDVDMNRDLIARQLENQGYGVESAEDGLQALKMLQEKDFDLILLDIMMPNMNGIEVLQHLKQHETWKYIPAIMISAMEEMDNVARCIEMGAEDYLSKPFESVILMARISASLEKKRLRDNEVSYLAQMKEIVKQQNYEIAEAASYVKSLLPPCISEGRVRTDWRFHPSTALGGDSFGYHWLDEDHFVIYLLDVSGHGVGAALLSISI
ncbi:MAG: response regulator, partial [Deltaproteobacteria bacterium]|nr:response regulator [Deltaproteobacteria bacterium]